ncbi:MAG: TRAP transporter small permease [Pararhodobacter sp.]|nr:TRAP transporter small permease [Pararhodobacter sp.]
MKALVGLIRAIEAGLRVAAALCLAGMFALVVMQVVLRYTGGGVPVFTEEAARYAMVWMAFLATAVAVREGSHIRIDLLPVALHFIARPLGRLLEALLDIIALGVFLVLVWQGLDMVQFAAAQRSEGLRISMAYPYAIVPFAFGAATLFAVARLILRDRLT